MKLGTSNCVNYSIWNPKHSAKYVYHTGTSASSIARAGTSCDTERRRTRNLSSTPWISSRFPITTKKGDPTGTVTERKKGITSSSSRIRSKKKCKKKNFLGIHDQFIRDEKFRKNMFDVGRTEEICRRRSVNTQRLSLSLSLLCFFCLILFKKITFICFSFS